MRGDQRLRLVLAFVVFVLALAILAWVVTRTT